MSDITNTGALEVTVSAVSRKKPWPGLMPFTEEAQAFFHGRDDEAAELLRLINRATLTVLFGQSGLGKSSLLNAGLFPRLRAAEFFPVYVRLDVSSQAPPLAGQVLAAIASTCTQHGVECPAITGEETLWEFFHRRDADFWSGRNRLLTPVLVLDQFEEIFTLGRHYEEMEQRCRAFLEQLGDLVEDRAPASLTRRIDADPALAEAFDFSRRTYKVVLSFREDYLAEFEGLSGPIRSIMQNRLRLTRMNGEQAKNAILRPGGHLVAETVAEQIIRFVAAPRSGARKDDDLARLEVEPALLSVVCRELNNQRLRRRQDRITADMLQAGAQQQIIRDFYESSLSGTDPRVREFIEDQLLTEAGFRDSYAYDDALALPGVTSEAIDRLIGGRLLRLEERSGVLRVELTHDLLTQVARESRDQRQKRDAELRTRELDAARRRRSRRVAAIGAFATAGAVSVAVVFAILLDRSTKEKHRLIETQSEVLLARANGQLDQNVAGEPQAILARSIELNRANNGAIGRAVSYLSSRTFPRKVAQLQAQVDPGDSFVAVEWQDKRSIAFVTAKGETLIPVPTDPAGAAARDVRAVPTPGGSSAPAGALRIVRGSASEAAWAKVELPISKAADGSVIAWIEGHDRLRVAWRAEGREQTLTLPDGGRSPLVLSPDGHRVMLRSNTGRVRVYDLSRQGPPVLLHDIAANDGTLRLGPDGQLVVALGKENVTLYDLGSDRLSELAHPLPVNSLEISADGKSLVTACQDKFARVWDIASGTLVADPLRHDSAVLYAAFDKEGNRVVTGALDGTARIWSVSTGELLAEPLATGMPVKVVRVSPDGTLALTSALEGRIDVWQVGNLPATDATIQLGSQITALESSSDRSLVALATADGGVSLWKVSDDGSPRVSATQVWAQRLQKRVREIRFSPDGNVLAVATLGNDVHLLRTESGVSLGRPLRHRGQVLAMRFSNDSALLATGSADGAARTWRVATQALRGYPMLHEGDAVGRVAFSADGELLLTASRSAASVSTLRVWDLGEGYAVARIAAGTGHLALAEFSAGKEIVAVHDATVSKWSLSATSRATSWTGGGTDGDELPQYTVAEKGKLKFGGLLVSAGISPDGTRLVVGGLDGASRIVEIATLHPSGEAMKSIGAVQAVNFARDGRWIVTSSADQLARVWDGVSGYAVTDGARHDIDSSGAVLTGGGAFLVSAEKDGIFALKKVGLDFPMPAPGWLSELLQAGGGGGIDQAGTFGWIADRSERLRTLRDRFAREDKSWWNRWATSTIARLALIGNAEFKGER